MATKKTTKKNPSIKFTNSKEEKLFPHYQSFPWRFEDKRENKTCWFQCQEHVEKYITRYNMSVKEYNCKFFDK